MALSVKKELLIFGEVMLKDTFSMVNGGIAKLIVLGLIENSGGASTVILVFTGLLAKFEIERVKRAGVRWDPCTRTRLCVLLPIEYAHGKVAV